MQQCKTVKACIELALTDAYGEYEQASAWLTCIEEMFGRFDRVKLMGEEVAWQGFDLANQLAVVATPAGRARSGPASLSNRLSLPISRRLKPAGSRPGCSFSRGLP